MKKLLRVAALMALMVLAAGLSSQVQAACASPWSIGPISILVYTPGFPFPPDGSSVSPDIKGVFWSLGALPGGGNPGPVVGNDNGSTAFDNWFYIGYTGASLYPAHLGGIGGASHWNATGVDGCIDGDGTNASASDPAQCMVILLTDDNDAGGGFFALLSTGPTAGDYDFAAATGGGPVTLAPLPKTNITTSVRNGDLSVDLTVNTQLPAAGQHLGCGQATLAGARYRLWVRDQADQTPAPSGSNSRDTTSWIPASNHGPHPIGSTVNTNVSCGGVDREFYLCSTIELPTGNGNFYQSTNCSQNSTRVECGPNIAEPPARPRPQPRPTTKPSTDRGTRR